MSFLEGVFSRAGRELAPLVEAAYREGALFCSWVDRFDLAPWRKVFEAAGRDPAGWLAARDPDAPLPWDHLSCGVSPGYLRRERERAVTGRITPDCRFGACTGCGVCNHEGRKSTLAAGETLEIRPRLNRPEREQEAVAAPSPPPREDLTRKAVHLRVWFAKTGSAVYLSQLELGRVFERALRRAGLKPSFSAGYHPLPQISFGRALPVGVASRAEWLAIFLRDPVTPAAFAERLDPNLPEGLAVVAAEELPPGKRIAQPVLETFELTAPEGQNRLLPGKLARLHGKSRLSRDLDCEKGRADHRRPGPGRRRGSPRTGHGALYLLVRRNLCQPPAAGRGGLSRTRPGILQAGQGPGGLRGKHPSLPRCLMNQN